MAGFIKISRDILDWEWYDDPNTFRVFIHLLLNANYEDKKYQGIDIRKGSLVIGRQQLAVDLGISEQNVRTALNHLKSTNEITIKVTSKFSIVTICNFERWQGIDFLTNQQTNQQINQQLTSNQPATNQQLTTTKEIKKERNEEYINNIPPIVPLMGETENVLVEFEMLQDEMSKLKEAYSALQTEYEELKKKKERKKKEDSFDVRADLSYVSDEYRGKWEEWLDYKDSIGKQYKAQSGAKKAYTHWINMANGSMAKANALVDYAQIHSWEGMYDIKDWAEPADHEFPSFPPNPRHGDRVGYDWFYDMNEGRWIKDGERNRRGEIFSVQEGKWLI